jgi:predicted RNA-binding Zn ribbon-like protein
LAIMRLLQGVALRPGPGWGPQGRIARVPPRDLAAVHRMLRRAVVAAVNGTPWAVPGRVATVMTTRGLELDGDFATRLAHVAARVLSAHRERLRRCARPGCPMIFYRVKRAEYCSPTCGQLVRDARKVTTQKRTSHRRALARSRSSR